MLVTKPYVLLCPGWKIRLPFIWGKLRRIERNQKPLRPNLLHGIWVGPPSLLGLSRDESTLPQPHDHLFWVDWRKTRRLSLVTICYERDSCNNEKPGAPLRVQNQ